MNPTYRDLLEQLQEFDSMQLDSPVLIFDFEAGGFYRVSKPYEFKAVYFSFEGRGESLFNGTPFLVMEKP